MKQISYFILLIFSVFLFNNCAEEFVETKDLNYITFESASMDLGVDIDGTAEYEIKVFTTNTSGSDRIFNISVVAESTNADASSYTVPASVTVPANSTEGTFIINLADVNIGDGVVLALAFESQDGLFVGDQITLSISQICPYNDVVLRINFDGYASECTWELFDANNTVISSGGPWADGTESATTKFCLEDGTYTFIIYDAYGDGLSYPSNGSAVITSNGVEVVRIEGDFGTSKSETFNISL